MPVPEHLSLSIPDTDLPRIVIVGGGFAGLHLAKKLRKVKAQVVMIDRNNFHTFQPLLYQVATAGLEPDSIAGPLRKTFEDHPNYYFRMTRVTGIDPERNEIETLIGNLKYDHLVLANGSVTNYFGNNAIKENGLPLKRVVHALNMRSHILQNFEQAVLTHDEKKLEQMMNIVIVGGGPTGVEVCGALSELRKHILPKDYPDLNLDRMTVYLVEGTSRLLNGMSEKSSQAALRYIENLGVDVVMNTLVEEYDGETARLSNGQQIPTHTVVWAAGVKGSIIPGLPEEIVTGSRVRVDEYSRVLGFKNLYAIGDLARMESEEYPDGHPMLAPVAMQQGNHLARNFLRHQQGKELKPYHYFDKGTMATIGRNKAVVDLPNGWHFKGLFAWIIWMFVHIMYLIGFRNKLITLNNWIWSYLTYDKGTRLIIRVFNRKEKLQSEEEEVVLAEK